MVERQKVGVSGVPYIRLTAVTPPTLNDFQREAKAHLSRPVHWPAVQPCVSVSGRGTGQTQHTGESPGDSLLSFIRSQEVNPIHYEAPRHTRRPVMSLTNTCGRCD